MTLMREAMQASTALAQCLEHCKLSNPRTYARTHKELLTLILRLTLRNARRGAARFIPIGERNGTAAGAARGLAVANHG